MGAWTSQVTMTVTCSQSRKWQTPPWKLFMTWKHKLNSLFTWRFCCCNLNASSATLLCCWRAVCCCCLLMSIISWNCLCICSTCAWCCCMRTSYNKSLPGQAGHTGTNPVIWEGGKTGVVKCEESEVTILVKVKTEDFSKIFTWKEWRKAQSTEIKCDNCILKFDAPNVNFRWLDSHIL